MNNYDDDLLLHEELQENAGHPNDIAEGKKVTEGGRRTRRLKYRRS